MQWISHRQVCYFHKCFFCLPIKLNLFLRDHVLGLGNYDNPLRNWRSRLHTCSCCSCSPTTALSTPHLLISLPIILSGCPSFTVLKPVINVPAARAESTFLWLHVRVTQLWGMCSGASGQDESQPWAAWLGRYRRKTWCCQPSIKQILLEVPLIEALTFKVKIFSGLLSDLMDRNTLKAALCNHGHDSTQREWFS